MLEQEVQTLDDPAVAALAEALGMQGLEPFLEVVGLLEGVPAPVGRVAVAADL